jgi:plastocyanin
MSDADSRFPVLPVTIVIAVVIVFCLAMFIGMAVWGMGMGMHGRGSHVAATPTVIAANEFTVRISDFEFVPSNVSVPIGSRVTWLNEDSAPHDATAQSGDWATQTLQDGESEAVAFDAPGTWEYYCTIHPYMEGVIRVR